MLSDSRSVLPGLYNNRRSHFRLTSSSVSIGSPPRDHPPRHKIIQLGIFLLDLFRDGDLFHHFSSLLESAIFPAIVMNEKDIMEWEEDSDEYIRKNIPSELHMGDFNYPRLAYFVAAISGSNKVRCQQVLEELDVYKQLRLSLELLKKEMEIQRILIDSTMLGVYDRFNKGLSDSSKVDGRKEYEAT
ncbi:unnamed protein product [Lactuca saligna]|uniref:Lon N-terminal domain-containing protein n=1 Tax=Lactuca saligna TaxID=75948 RepID=A0AA35Y540_LACSI|nr:unnamed protein product [Lactuca saligna]